MGGSLLAQDQRGEFVLGVHYVVGAGGFEPVSYTHLDVYKRQGRLARAAALLDAGATAEAAAREAGYANMSFFYKKFAERYGCTPAAYRQRFPR